MLYKFKGIIENQTYEFCLDFETTKKCVGITEFNFPKDKKISAVVARLATFIDFTNLDSTVAILSSKGFEMQNKKNYVKLFCDLYKMFYESDYKTPTKEAAMLHTVLSCDESEATKLFNLFFTCQEYWAKPKTIAVFCKYVNEVRRLLVTPKTEATKIGALPKTNPDKVVYLTEMEHLSLAMFEQEVRKYNKNMGTQLSNQEFADRFNFTILADKVLTNRKK
jgi:hypothetical protein